MDVLIVIGVVAFAVWWVRQRKAGAGAGRGGGPPPPSGPRRDAPPRAAAPFSVEGRESWPAAALKAVEVVHQIAEGDEPTTLGRMRSLAKRASGAGEKLVDAVEQIMRGLAADDPRMEGFDELLSEASALLDLALDAEDAEDELDVDVIGAAQGFMDAWGKAPNP